MIVCPKCGKQSQDGDYRCLWCGEILSAIGPFTPTSEQIPEGIKGWSWAAFLWTWVWAIGNNTYVGLLVLVPIPGVAAVMAIVLGLYGREWAWKNKKWSSVEEFNRVQGNWIKWYLIISLMGLGALILGWIMLAGGLQSGLW